MLMHMSLTIIKYNNNITHTNNLRFTSCGLMQIGILWLNHSIRLLEVLVKILRLMDYNFKEIEP